MPCFCCRLLLCAVVLMLSGGLVSEVSAQSLPSTLRIRLGGDIRSTDPGVNRDANSDMVVMHIVEGLVAYREDTSVGLLLAESVNISADRRAYTFKLRRDVRFHNGAPLTAADVLFSWRRYMAPQTHWRCLAEFDGRGTSKVVDINAPDAETVVFTLEKPSALFLTMLARTDCGGTGIYHRDSIARNGKWVAPIGTGPFKLATWRRGQYVELERNANYAALPGRRDGFTGHKTAEVEKVRFTIIPDVSASKAALLSGSIDLIFDVDTEDLSELRQRRDITLSTSPTLNLNGILLQSRQWPLSDVRIRRALALSLDLPLLVSSVTTGMSQASRSAIPLASRFYTAAQSAVPARDLARARQLLAESGYKGESIKLLTTVRYKNMFEIAVLAQAMALEVGIRLEIEVHDWATLLDAYNKQKYDAMTFSFSSRVDPSLFYGTLVGIGAEQTGRVWNDSKAQALLNKSTASADPAERQLVFDELDALLLDDVPVIFMYSAVKIAAARTDVSGYAGWPMSYPRAWGVKMRSP